MAQAASAYRYNAYPDYAAYPAYPDYAAYPEERFSPADVRAIRTGGAPQEQASSSLLVTAGVMAAIVLVVIAALSFARIALTNATVTTMIQSDALSAQIQDARTDGVALEMQQSVLTNTNAIKSAAKRLGMGEPYEVGSIVLTPDVVACTDGGALSLSDSVKSLVSIKETQAAEEAEAAKAAALAALEGADEAEDDVEYEE